MKSENTSLRLKKLMSEKNLKQVDILEKCKPFCEKYGITMNKSDISQYVSGKTEPGSKKLTILSLALGVTETWLMGYDVPMDREVSTEYLATGEETPTNSIEDLDGVYLSLAREAQENGLDPDDIKLAIETIKSIKRARGE